MIDGLILFYQYFSEEFQNDLIALIDSNDWDSGLKRRVQQFGHQYNYKNRQVSTSKILPIPLWGKNMIEKMLDSGISTKKFDQMIINEYLPGQGISSHIDSVSGFDDEILSVSLGSSCIINFSRKTTGEDHEILLMPGDLLMVKGEARYRWHHQIKSRKCDIWKGKKIVRGRRISITFRKVLN